MSLRTHESTIVISFSLGVHGDVCVQRRTLKRDFQQQLWWDVSFDIWLDDIPIVLKQLFMPDQADHWTGVYVETTGRAVLLGVMVGVAILTVLSFKVVRWRR